MTSNPFVGTATVEERLSDQNVLWKSIARRVALTLRCGLPGIIIGFDAATQYCSVQLLITENIVINEVTNQISIPILNDVLLMLPGDLNWCITFPSLIGSECYVCFADMCINAWATNGPGVAPNQAQNQEVNRRHDLSDGFAILRPRSKPNAIASYSTTSMEIRSTDNSVKIGLDSSGIALTAPLLSWNQNPIASSTGATLAIPITLNGTVYYIKLSTTP